MSLSGGPLTAFDFHRVISGARQVFSLGLRPLAIIFGADAVAEIILTTAVDLLGGSAALKVVMSIATIAIYCCAFGAATRVLHNIGYGHPPDMRDALDEVVQKFKPLVVVGLGASIATMIGIAAFIAPGLWLMGLWAIIFPLMMIENAGMSAFSRSAALTQDYRWQAVGAIVMVLAPMVLVAYIAMSVLGFLPSSGGIFTALVRGVVTTGIDVITSGASVAVTLSIYKRLIDLKETADPDGIANIFE
jgi:hypothetical protein